MMQRLLLILFLFGLYSCGSDTGEPGKPVVAVSIQPQKYLVSTIADTLFDVVVMVPPGASPATWEPTPAQMKSLDHALIYFRIGHIGFEQAWMDRIIDLNEDMPVVDLSTAEGMELIQVDYTHGDHSHVGIDPHTWLSPARMEIMARTTYFQLAELMPEHKKYFRANYEKLLGEIKNADRQVKKDLEGYYGKSFLIFHPSLAYFAQDYGLKQFPIEYEGKEPTLAHMRNIIDQAEKEGLKTIFVQEEFDRRNAGVIAEEIGGRVIQINPLSEDWDQEIISIGTKLRKSFK